MELFFWVGLRLLCSTILTELIPHANKTILHDFLTTNPNVHRRNWLQLAFSFCCIFFIFLNWNLLTASSSFLSSFGWSWLLRVCCYLLQLLLTVLSLFAVAFFFCVNLPATATCASYSAASPSSSRLKLLLLFICCSSMLLFLSSFFCCGELLEFLLQSPSLAT